MAHIDGDRDALYGSMEWEKRQDDQAYNVDRQRFHLQGATSARHLGSGAGAIGPKGAEMVYDPTLAKIGTRNQDIFNALADPYRQGAEDNLRQQGDALGLLRSAAYGEQPSAAEAMLRANTDMASQQMYAAMGSQRGGGVGANLQAAGAQGTQAKLQAGQQAAVLRAQEMATARHQYAGMIAGYQAMNASIATQYMQMGFERDQAQMLAYMQQANMQASITTGVAGFGVGGASTGMQGAAAGAEALGAIMQGIAQLGGGAAAASDERLKTNVAKSRVNEMLDALADYEFDYKDPNKYGQGRHVGVMAQDLEKTSLGASMVLNTPEGKMVDLRKMTMAALAAAAHLNKRVTAVENAGR